MPGGRPRVLVVRYAVDYPPPNPQPAPCRIWQGPLDRDGYGLVNPDSHGRRRMRAHRWIYEMAYGPIIPGLVVRHLCDNRPCYRLSHLELGTVAENVEDARKRGRLGPAPTLRPSEILYLFIRRDRGETFAEIYRTWPGGCPVGQRTLDSNYRRLRGGYDERYRPIPTDEPPPPDLPIEQVLEQYRRWRDDDVVRPRAIRRSADAEGEAQGEGPGTLLDPHVVGWDRATRARLGLDP